MPDRRAFLKGLGAALVAVNLWFFPQPNDDIHNDDIHSEIVWQVVSVDSNRKIITIKSVGEAT